jgi:hypothetical protein
MIEVLVPSMEIDEPSKSTPKADERGPCGDREIQDEAARASAITDGDAPTAAQADDDVLAVTGSS